MIENKIVFGLLIATFGNLFFFLVGKLVGTYTTNMTSSKLLGSVIALILSITFYVYMIFYWLELLEETS